MSERRREFRVRDSSTRAAKHSTGNRASFVVPPGLSMWRPPKEGSKTIDVIPFECTREHLRYPEKLQFAAPGEWYGERTFFAHAGIGVNNEWHTCPARTFGLRCPICEARAEFNQSPHKEDQDRAAKLKPKDRQLFLIYDQDATERGVQLWEAAYWNFGKQLDKYIDGARPSDKPAYRNYYHPYDGFTMRITASPEQIGGGKPNTIYSIHAFYKRDKELSGKLFDHGYDLDAMIKTLDYEDLRAIYRGEVDVDDEEDDGLVDTNGTDDRNDDRRDEDKDETPHPVSPPPPPPAKTRERASSPPPPPSPPPVEEAKEEVEFASLDIVEFTFFDRRCQGQIESIDREKGTAIIKLKGEKKSVSMEFEELTLVKRDETFDRKDSGGGSASPSPPTPPPPADGKTNKSQRTSDWDEADPDEKTKPPAKKGSRSGK